MALGEERGELEPRNSRPHAHPAGIDMHEGDAGGRVIADAAPLPYESGVAQHFHRNVGEGDIGCLAENVLASLRLAAAMLAQSLIGRGGAVTADEMDGYLRAKLLM